MQQEQRRALPQTERAVLQRVPEVTDDYIRNFLLRNGMHTTLECFEVEWYERFGSAAQPDIPLIPNNYLESAALLNRIEVLEQDLQRHAELTTKTTKQWAQARRDRDLHRSHHNRLVQEKNKLEALLRQARQHSDAVSPAMQELRQRCNQLLKSKTLLTMERDRLQQRVSAMESDTTTNTRKSSAAAAVSAEKERRLRKAGKTATANPAAKPSQASSSPTVTQKSKRRGDAASTKTEARADGFVWPADERPHPAINCGLSTNVNPADSNHNNSAHSANSAQRTQTLSRAAAATAASAGTGVHANIHSLSTANHTSNNAHARTMGQDNHTPMQWVQRYHFVAHSMSVSSLAMHPRKPAVASGSDDGSWRLSALPHGDVIASSPSALTLGGGEEEETDDEKDDKNTSEQQQPQQHHTHSPDDAHSQNRVYGHTNWIAGVAMHPHGTMLATGSGDQTIRLWDFAQTRSARTMTGHTDGIWDVDFHDTGVLLASAGLDKTARVWDVEYGRCRQTLRGHTDAVNSVRWQPHGNMLCNASADKSISLWDARHGRCVETLYGHRNAVLCAATSAQSGEVIASCDAEGVVMMWDVRNMRARLRHVCGPQAASQVAIDATERYVAVACDDGVIRMLDTYTAPSRHPNKGAVEAVGDPQTPCEVAELLGHEDAVQCLAFDPATNAFLVSGGSDRTIRYWQ